MLKSGKKILLLLLALALTLGVLAGCNPYNADPLDGYTSSENAAESNGGFVVKKDEWFYFINGAESYTASNTFGAWSRARSCASTKATSPRQLRRGDIVVPQLMISEDHTSGVFIYGDYVYYATPNTVRNMDGEIESSYLDFRRTRLDGIDTLSGYYVQLPSNDGSYRYVQVDGTVYLLYVDRQHEIHSVNTETREDTVSSPAFRLRLRRNGPRKPYIYYTMPVVKKNTYEYHAARRTATAKTRAITSSGG